MKTITAAILCLLVLLGAYGCQESESDRLSALEAEVSALKAESQAREDALREELAMVRKNLEGIKALLEIDEGRAKIQEGTESGKAPSDKELDEKAKSFVSENLDRLLTLTKKLLDKMEKELDEQLEGMNKPAPPQGDEI